LPLRLFRSKIDSRPVLIVDNSEAACVTVTVTVIVIAVIAVIAVITVITVAGIAVAVALSSLEKAHLEKNRICCIMVRRRKIQINNQIAKFKMTRKEIIIGPAYKTYGGLRRNCSRHKKQHKIVCYPENIIYEKRRTRAKYIVQ
jgi:hypothetical protein